MIDVDISEIVLARAAHRDDGAGGIGTAFRGFFSVAFGHALIWPGRTQKASLELG